LSDRKRPATLRPFAPLRKPHSVSPPKRSWSTICAMRAIQFSRWSLLKAKLSSAMPCSLGCRRRFPRSLGPVAVWPERQRSGVGSQLIREGIARSEAAGWLGIFVLGNPAFYRRFGFDAGKASGFISPYAGPHWMALPLGRSELPTSTGSIQHAPAFAKPG
jgi:putative acetyltransferase